MGGGSADRRAPRRQEGAGILGRATDEPRGLLGPLRRSPATADLGHARVSGTPGPTGGPRRGDQAKKSVRRGRVSSWSPFRRGPRGAPGGGGGGGRGQPPPRYFVQGAGWRRGPPIFGPGGPPARPRGAASGARPNQQRRGEGKR